MAVYCIVVVVEMVVHCTVAEQQGHLPGTASAAVQVEEAQMIGVAVAFPATAR